MPMFALCDINNAYVSMERLFRPDLEGKPVIVLSNNDGCCVARSAEVKKLGIKMGDPLFKISHLVEQHNITVFSSNYTLYGDLSNRYVTILETFTPEVEVYSIDECFLGLDGFEQNYDLAGYGRKIKETVKQQLGLPICVGIAPTKTLAKIANRIAKKYEAYGGVVYLDTKEKQQASMKRIPVEDVWGIGRQYAGKLGQYNITTAYELSKVRPEWARKHLGGVVGVRMIAELNGTSCLPLELVPPAKKNIACTRSFGRPVTGYEELSQAVASYTTRAAEKLRKQQSVAGLVTVFIHTNFFSSLDKPYSGSLTLELPVSTHDTGELIGYALLALRRIYKEGYVYKKAGVILNGIIPQNPVQISLFDARDRGKSKALMETLDKINARMGRGTVSFAASGTVQEWKMISTMKSGRYTTSWKELLVVKA